MRCELLRHPDGCCGILQERIAEASVDGLPVAWRRGLTGARLECGHEFHAHALGLHFFLTHMRCPLCRHGHDERLAAESVPRSARKAYAARRARVEEEREREDEALLEEALSAAQFEDDHLELLTVCATFRTRQGESSESIVSPLVRGAADLTSSPHMTEFCAQRCWRRQVSCAFSRALRMDAQAEGLFTLRHPMLQEPVASAVLRCQDVLAFCEGSKAAAAVPLHLHGAALADLLFNPLTGEALLRVDAETLHHMCIESLVRQLQESVQVGLVAELVA